MNIPYILQNIPFLNHLTDAEILALYSVSEVKAFPKNSKIDIKKIHAFGVILDGIFEMGQRIRGDRLYLAPGSFFGNIPFAVSHHAGTIKAVKDSSILLIKPQDMYRAMLSSFKALKGYIRNLKGNGFDTIDSAKDFLAQGSKVITIFGQNFNSGTSLLSAMMGLLLSEKDSVVILDASDGSGSVFNIFQKDLLPAVSQKPEESPADDGDSIFNKLVNINDNLSLLNISAGAKIKINPDIISPIIFILSRKFKYVIIDHSGYRSDFTHRIFDASDIILPVIKSINDKSGLHEILDPALKDGQRVYYVLNRYFEKTIGTFEGGYILDDIDFNRKDDMLSNLQGIISGNRPKVLDELYELITPERTGLVVQSSLTNASFLSGFFSTLYEKDIHIDSIYSSSWSYLATALYVISQDRDTFEKNFAALFAEEKLKSFLEVSFPDEFLYKSGRVKSFIGEMAAESRIEHYSVIPAAMASDTVSGSARMFSTGLIRDLFAASFITDIFEPVEIAGMQYNSGYPRKFVRPEHLLRTDTDIIRSVIVNNKQRLGFGEKRIPEFFRGYIDRLSSGDVSSDLSLSKKDFIINADEGSYDIKEIMNISADICRDMK